MKRLIRTQFNFNTFIGIVCTALVGFAIKKVDGINTSVIQTELNERRDAMDIQDHSRAIGALQLHEIKQDDRIDTLAVMVTSNTAKIDRIENKIRYEHN